MSGLGITHDTQVNSILLVEVNNKACRFTHEYTEASKEPVDLEALKAYIEFRWNLIVLWN